MTSIRKEIVLRAPAVQVWDALRDVGALHTRLVPGFVIDTRVEPDARVVTFSNGQVVRELIVEVNEAQRRVVWAIVDNPYEHYNASAQVFASLPGWSRFVGVVDLLPNALTAGTARMMEHGIAALARVFWSPLLDRPL